MIAAHTFRSVSSVKRAESSRYSAAFIAPDWASAKPSLTRLKRSMGDSRGKAPESFFRRGGA